MALTIRTDEKMEKQLIELKLMLNQKTNAGVIKYILAQYKGKCEFAESLDKTLIQKNYTISNLKGVIKDYLHTSNELQKIKNVMKCIN